MQYPAYIIHHSSCTDRDSIVEDLIRQTNGIVVPAVWLEDRKAGCRLSHQLVAKMAKEQHPDSPYLVFEDDCILRENWQECLKFWNEKSDVLYLGYNGKHRKHIVLATHALMISPRARDIIIDHTEDYVEEVENTGAYDWILNYLCADYKLRMILPLDKDKWCYQQEGLISTITGNAR